MRFSGADTKLCKCCDRIQKCSRYKKSSTLNINFRSQESCLDEYSNEKFSPLIFILSSRLLQLRARSTDLNLIYSKSTAFMKLEGIEI